MNRIGNTALAYSQAPWRKELRFIGLFSLGLVFLALLAGIYVILSANIAAVGRDIEETSYKIDKIDWEIEEMESRLGRIQSMEAMEQRARAMGFKSVDPEEIIYLPIPGYVRREPVNLAPKTLPPVTGAVTIPPRYTETIFTWLKRQPVWRSIPFTELLP